MSCSLWYLYVMSHCSSDDVVFSLLHCTGSNQLTGSIPTEIGTMSQRAYLDLGKWSKMVYDFDGWVACLSLRNEKLDYLLNVMQCLVFVCDVTMQL